MAGNSSNDSEDYEILPMQELEDLRREVSGLKRNNLTEGDKAKLLIESMDRLAVSINRLITILDDAQKDIIDEYQQAKPVETLHQLAEQNEMIAKALISISDNLNGGKSVVFPSQYQESQSGQSGNPRSILPSSFNPEEMPQMQSGQMQGPGGSAMGMNMPGNMMNNPFQGNMGAGNNNGINNMNNMNNNFNMNPGNMGQGMPQMQGTGQRSPRHGKITGMPKPSGISMPPMDDMPSMDPMPPLNQPSAEKKKFLGIL